MNELIEDCNGFQWDEGNSEKNWKKHKVTKNECEQVFFNLPFLIEDDTEHSAIERRWYILGQTDSKKMLFIVFTIRNQLIRVISARNMNKREKEIYHEQIKKYSQV
jgi:uncharacterized protein